MISFDARMALIRQRAEALKKQRKKRRAVFLATCIPVALCVAALAVWNWKPETPQPDIVGGIAAGSGDAGDGMVPDFPVSVTCGDRVYTQVDEILALVQTVTAPVAPEAAPPQDNQQPTEGKKDTTENNMDNFGFVTDSSSANLTFTLRQDGESQTYELTPTHLIHTETQEKFPLTQQQYETLTALLTR